MLKVVESKCFFCVNLKLACFCIGYFLLIVHISVTAMVMYTSLMFPKHIDPNDPDAMRKISNLLLLGQFVYPLCLSNVKFTVILIYGLHLSHRVLIRIYVMYATFTMLVYVAGCFVVERMLQNCVPASISVLVTTIQAYFIYTVRRHWLQLNPDIQKILKQTV